VVTLIAKLLLFSHMVGCGWMALANFADDRNATWLALYQDGIALDGPVWQQCAAPHSLTKSLCISTTFTDRFSSLILHTLSPPMCIRLTRSVIRARADDGDACVVNARAHTGTCSPSTGPLERSAAERR
jgi:hypothetical protein